MKYLIRAVKYFLYVSILATVMILVLVAAKVIKSDVILFSATAMIPCGR